MNTQPVLNETFDLDRLKLIIKSNEFLEINKFKVEFSEPDNHKDQLQIWISSEEPKVGLSFRLELVNNKIQFKIFFETSKSNWFNKWRYYKFANEWNKASVFFHCYHERSIHRDGSDGFCFVFPINHYNDVYSDKLIELILLLFDNLHNHAMLDCNFRELIKNNNENWRRTSIIW